MPIFQNKSKNAALMGYSLNDMVIAITKNPKVFKGKSHIIIDKIKAIKNNGANGCEEISKAWDIVASGEAKRKIDKYFNKALKVVNGTENEYLKVSVKSEPESEILSNKLTEASSLGEKEVKPNPVLEKIESKFNKFTANVKGAFDLTKLKEINQKKESQEVKEVFYSSFEELMDNLKGGARLSEKDLSYIKILMGYIRTRKAIDENDQARTELEDFFMGIIGALHNDADKKRVLKLFQEQRFISLYSASCRVETYAVESLLEKQGFPKDTITTIKDYLIDCSSKYLSKIKLNELDYDNYIKNIKKYKDFEIFKGVEMVEKINLIKEVLSEKKFTSENRKFLTELSHNFKDGRIIDFVKEKMNSDIELLRSECNDKRIEEKNASYSYIKAKNKDIDTGVNRIKSMLIMKSVPKKIMDSVMKVFSDKRDSTNIDIYSSQIDLIIEILQCKKIKTSKIAHDIERYLNISKDELKSEVEIAKSKKTSFKDRMFSLFNDFNHRVLNFIYNVTHSFK